MSAGRQLTERVTEIARRTNRQQAQIVEGTVIGRNPDGTLVVDDGRGGCLRQAPKANVRVGQRIKLGLEPSLGQQTNLPQVTLTYDPSTAPCPHDPRECEQVIGLPEPCTSTETPVVFAPGTSQQFFWSRTAASGIFWSDRIPPNGGTLVAGAGVFRSLINYADSITDDTSLDDVQCSRIHLLFDTSEIPAGATITGVTLNLRIPGTALTYLETETAGAAVVVCPSTADGTSDLANWDKFTPVDLGRKTIVDIIAEGGAPGGFIPFTVSIPIPDGAEYFTPGGLARFALLLSDDFDSTDFPYGGDLKTNFVAFDWEANSFELAIEWYVEEY